MYLLVYATNLQMWIKNYPKIDNIITSIILPGIRFSTKKIIWLFIVQQVELVKAQTFRKEWAPYSRLISRSLCPCSKCFLKGCEPPRPFSVSAAILSRDPVEKRSVSKIQLRTVIIKKKKKYLTDFNEFIFTETNMFIFLHNRIFTFPCTVTPNILVKTFVARRRDRSSRPTVRFSTMSPPEKT